MEKYTIKWVWLDSGKGPESGIITDNKIDYWFFMDGSPSPVKCSYTQKQSQKFILCVITDEEKNALFEEHKKYCLLTKKPLMHGDPFFQCTKEKELKHIFNINNNTIQGVFHTAIDKINITNFVIPNRIS